MIDSLDHLVLTVRDIGTAVAFYERVMGMKETRFRAADGVERVALSFGQQKINLHLAGREFEPKAAHPLPGSADLCFLTARPLDHMIAHLKSCNVEILEGPVRRTGATGPLLSVYIRDPDRNLIEISNRIAA
jgi:catechol 2,3-dioxygenase-like lactoylglutathione lyase family enzyme